MNCGIHEQTPAVGRCGACGQPLCLDCAIQWQGRTTCKACLEAGNARKARPRVLRKSPVLAALLSLFPGLGQIYVGYYLMGFVHLAVVALLTALMSAGGASRPGMGPLLGMFLAFFWLFNVIDAARRASHYNRHLSGDREEKPPTDSPLFGGIALLIIGLILTLEITLGVDLKFLDKTWPLAILAVSALLLGKYLRARRRLREPIDGWEKGGEPEDRQLG